MNFYEFLIDWWVIIFIEFEKKYENYVIKSIDKFIFGIGKNGVKCLKWLFCLIVLIFLDYFSLVC